MFPSNQYKTLITVFTPYADNAAGSMRYYRKELQQCFWNSDSISVNRAGGTATPEQVELNIPLMFNEGYVNRGDWVITSKVDLENVWTIRTGGELESSLIFQGEVKCPELEIWQGSEELGRTLSTFRKLYGSKERLPSNVDEILYGPKSMYRVTVAC